MTVIKIDFSNTGLGTTDPEYNNVELADQGVYPLNDITGVASGVTLACTGSAVGSTTNQSVTGDVPPFLAAAINYYRFNSGITIMEFSGFPANESIEVSFVGHSSTQATRDAQIVVNGNTYVYDSNGTNTPEPALVFTEAADVNGTLSLSFSSVLNPVENYYMSAIQLETGATPTAVATLDAPLVYGSAFSGTYSNYTGVPTGPVTVTDSQSNELSIAVTINDNGDGTGTFSGTFPSLPAAGNDAPALLTGDITLNLPDPGV